MCIHIHQRYAHIVELNSSFDLLFPSSGVTDYVLINDPFGGRNLSSFTITTWIKTSYQGNKGTILSYATTRHENALTISDADGYVSII